MTESQDEQKTSSILKENKKWKKNKEMQSLPDISMRIVMMMMMSYS